MTWQFWAGAAMGSIVTLIAILLVQNAGKADALQKTFEAEDKVKTEGAARAATIEAQRKAEHDAIDTLTPAELDEMLRDGLTLDDVLRQRAQRAAVTGSEPTK